MNQPKLSFFCRALLGVLIAVLAILSLPAADAPKGLTPEAVKDANKR